VSDRGISVEDLGQEDVDGRDGVEEGSSPLMADAAADGEDGGSIEEWGGVLLEAVKDANNPVMHQEASWTGWGTNTIVTGGSSLCNLFCGSDLSRSR
jgi:hypothetical protein